VSRERPKRTWRRQRIGFSRPVERLSSRGWGEKRGKKEDRREMRGREEGVVSVAPSLYPNHPSVTSHSASTFSVLQAMIRPLQSEIATD